MNTAPLAVRKEMSAARVHRTFVTLGMRHLCVVNSHNHVCGIITRKDLMHAAEHGVEGHSATTHGGGTSEAPSHNGAAAAHVDSNEVSEAFVVPDLPSGRGEAQRGVNGSSSGTAHVNGSSHGVSRRR